MIKDYQDPNLNWRFNQADYEEKFGRRIAQLIAENRSLKSQIEDLEEQAVKGDHFDIILKAVKENPLLRKEWDRFMMSLRMCGYD